MSDLASEKLSLLSSAIHGHHIPAGDQGFCPSGISDFSSLFQVAWKKGTTKARARAPGVPEWYWGTGRDSNFTMLQCRPKVSPPN